MRAGGDRYFRRCDPEPLRDRLHQDRAIRRERREMGTVERGLSLPPSSPVEQRRRMFDGGGDPAMIGRRTEKHAGRGEDRGSGIVRPPRFSVSGVPGQSQTVSGEHRRIRGRGNRVAPAGSLDRSSSIGRIPGWRRAGGRRRAQKNRRGRGHPGGGFSGCEVGAPQGPGGAALSRGQGESENGPFLSLSQSTGALHGSAPPLLSMSQRQAPRRPPVLPLALVKPCDRKEAVAMPESFSLHAVATFSALALIDYRPVAGSFPMRK